MKSVQLKSEGKEIGDGKWHVHISPRQWDRLWDRAPAREMWSLGGQEEFGSYGDCDYPWITSGIGTWGHVS